MSQEVKNQLHKACKNAANALCQEGKNPVELGLGIYTMLAISNEMTIPANMFFCFFINIKFNK